MDNYVKGTVIAETTNAQGKVLYVKCECGCENIIYYWSFCGCGKRCSNCKQKISLNPRRVTNEY